MKFVGIQIWLLRCVGFVMVFKVLAEYEKPYTGDFISFVVKFVVMSAGFFFLFGLQRK